MKRDTFIYMAFVIMLCISFLANSIASTKKQQQEKREILQKNIKESKKSTQGVWVRYYKSRTLAVNPKNLEKVFEKNEIIPETINRDETEE